MVLLPALVLFSLSSVAVARLLRVDARVVRVVDGRPEKLLRVVDRAFVRAHPVAGAGWPTTLKTPDSSRPVVAVFMLARVYFFGAVSDMSFPATSVFLFEQTKKGCHMGLTAQ
jgi:hypothetical protein